MQTPSLRIFTTLRPVPSDIKHKDIRTERASTLFVHILQRMKLLKYTLVKNKAESKTYEQRIHLFLSLLSNPSPLTALCSKNKWVLNQMKMSVYTFEHIFTAVLQLLKFYILL
jgi:hypothetical protein